MNGKSVRAVLVIAVGPLAAFAGMAGLLSPAAFGVTFTPDAGAFYAGMSGEIATEPGRIAIYGRAGYAGFKLEESP